jgi:hypothetical protein
MNRNSPIRNLLTKEFTLLELLKNFLLLLVPTSMLYSRRNNNDVIAFRAYLSAISNWIGQLSFTSSAYDILTVTVPVISIAIIGYHVIRIVRGFNSGGKPDSPDISTDQEHYWFLQIKERYDSLKSDNESASFHDLLIDHNYLPQEISNIHLFDIAALKQSCLIYTNNTYALNYYNQFFETIKLRGGKLFYDDLILQLTFEEYSMYNDCILLPFEKGLCKFIFDLNLGFSSCHQVEFCFKFIGNTVY